MAMLQRNLVALLALGFLNCAASSAEKSPFPFVDGIWRGGIETDANTTSPRLCWASTTLKDATTFTLEVRSDKSWQLRLSNAGWRMPAAHRFDVVAQVDFYPRLRIVGSSESPTMLEFRDIERLSLLRLIENGHTIDLRSTEFNAKYDLEGSAKIIARLRDCFMEG